MLVTTGNVILLTLSCLSSYILLCAAVHIAFDNNLAVEGVKSSFYHAGPLGNHAGLLSGAQAISQLDYAKAAGEAANDPDIEAHDFSEAASANNAGGSDHGDTLGSLGDHLQERHFPADFGEDHGATAAEYEEVDAGVEGAATEEHEAYSQLGEESHGWGLDLQQHLDKLDFHGDYNNDFHSEAIVGIDHGKGAFSYSTLYEHKHGQEGET